MAATVNYYPTVSGGTVTADGTTIAGDGSAGDPLELFGGTRVTLGSAAQLITIPSLDLNADGGYEIELFLDCANNPGSLTLRPNGLTTNLVYRLLYVDAGATPTGSANAGGVFAGSGGSAALVSGTIKVSGATGTFRTFDCMVYDGTFVAGVRTVVQWQVTTNLTSLEIVSANANGFNSGSFVRYRKTGFTA